MRGCVRVTGVGVEAVVEGCRELEVFDVSQCKNLEGWVRNGGEEKMQRVRERDGGKAIRFLNVKTGSNLR